MNATRVAAAVLAAAFLSTGSVSPASACTLHTVAELPLIVEGGEAFVEASIDGQPVRLLVDTGATTTLLTPAAAKALGLHTLPLHGYTTYGVGGFSVPESARIHEFKLGRAAVRDFDIMVTGAIRSKDFVGLLGDDVLGGYDLEFDVADKMLRLFRPEACQGDQVVYWNKAYSVVSLAPSNLERDAPKLFVVLNGRKTLAELDSGSGRSVVTTVAARNVGVTPQSAEVQRSDGAMGMGGSVQTWVGVFPTLTIGDETIQNAELELADLFGRDQETQVGSNIPRNVDEFPGMLLGFDFVRAHRIYIARSQEKVYFSYNGGPIFESPKSNKAPEAAKSEPPKQP